jgi:hypothetical protein
MRLSSSLKHQLKRIRWQARRASSALRWGNSHLKAMPAVLGNAMPKSGSHLIIQVLHGLAQIGPFVNPGFPPVNRTEDNTKLSDQAILANIRSMRPGDIAYGYISAVEPFISTLTAPGRATIFVYRDPRDMIISQIFYAMEMYEEHWMHDYYTQELHSMEERINAAIQGVQRPGTELTPLRKRYQTYLGWLDQPRVLSLRLEDLLLNREAALNRLLDYLAEHGFRHQVSRSNALAVLSQSIAPKKSGTFRKGKPGNWKEHFTDANKALFKEQVGDLLIQLGYENDQNW